MKTASKVIEQALAWLGRNETDNTHRPIIDVYNSQKKLPRGYKVKYTDAWCAVFVSSVSFQLGYTNIIPTECSCVKMIELFQKMGCWVENDSYTPKKGDIIFYDWNDNGVGDNRGVADHVGIVENVTGKVITVLEGNYNNEVGWRILYTDGRYIRGYGVPKYDTQKIKTVTEIAKEVIKGIWGNGEERKAKLKASGYNPTEVQAAVNKVMTEDLIQYGQDKLIEAVAKEVIQGKWGNGKERKEKLTKSGYNYSAIQKRVDELLK